MTPEVYGVQPGEHIPGAVLHRYLTDFAKKFGVYGRIKFNTKVESLEPTADGGWLLSTISNGASEKLETKKIILATGLTSQPNFPAYPGAETFEAPYFHAKGMYPAHASYLRHSCEISCQCYTWIDCLLTSGETSVRTAIPSRRPKTRSSLELARVQWMPPMRTPQKACTLTWSFVRTVMDQCGYPIPGEWF